MDPTLLFDLDGTLTETDHLHFEAFHQILGAYGVAVDWETYRTRIIGKNNPVIAAEFLPHVPTEQHADIMDRKEAAYRERATALEPAPGLLSILDWAHGRGLGCGVVTNAPRLNAEYVLDRLGLTSRFDVLVIGPELEDAKPHPLPYLMALGKMRGDPARSVGFEDSPSGARSAVAAGLGVVGLLTSVEPEDLTGVGVELTARTFADPAVLDYVKRRTGIRS